MSNQIMSPEEAVREAQLTLTNLNQNLEKILGVQVSLGVTRMGFHSDKDISMKQKHFLENKELVTEALSEIKAVQASLESKPISQENNSH